MSGHFLSIDGLVMWRQALAIAYYHSWSLVPPIWWGSTLTSSYRGVGASLEYVPGSLIFQWLASHVPIQSGDQYDFRLIYSDLLYTVAGAPVWVPITAATAYVVGLTTRLLGGDARLALWAIAFYGLGSPALAASRGDWPQPLVAICWALGVYASLKFRYGGGQRWLWVAGASIFYGVLARPLEGSMLLPAVVVLLWPATRQRPVILAGQVGAWALGVGATLLFNWTRFGSPTNFGYPGSIKWSTPIWIGFPSALLSPGRGVLWEFPALVLAALGAVHLWRNGRRLEAAALVGAPFVLFVEACQYFEWIGGWDWGFRFFVPALPLVSALAGVGVGVLRGRLVRWLPGVLLAGGLFWNIPAVTTDLLAGYGQTYITTAANWRLDAYPPIGAWRFVQQIFPTGDVAGSPIDIVWFRATRVVGYVSLIPFAVLAAASVALWIAALRRVGGRGEA